MVNTNAQGLSRTHPRTYRHNIET